MWGLGKKWAFFWHNVQAFQTFMVCHLLHAQLFSYHQDGASGEEASVAQQRSIITAVVATTFCKCHILRPQIFRTHTTLFFAPSFLSLLYIFELPMNSKTSNADPPTRCNNNLIGLLLSKYFPLTPEKKMREMRDLAPWYINLGKGWYWNFWRVCVFTWAF